MPLPVYRKKFTPRQLNNLVDDAVNGIFVPLGQGEKFEKALFALARNPHRTDEDIASVRDMTKYNWRAAAEKEKGQDKAAQAGKRLRATHVTGDGRLASNIREGVFLVENMLPLSDLEAHHRGMEFHPIAEERDFTVTNGVLEMAFAYQHPALAH